MISQPMNTDTMKHGADAVAAGATALSILEWMPEIAALCAVIWYTVRFIEYTVVKVREYKQSRN